MVRAGYAFPEWVQGFGRVSHDCSIHKVEYAGVPTGNMLLNTQMLPEPGSYVRDLFLRIHEFDLVHR